MVSRAHSWQGLRDPGDWVVRVQGKRFHMRNTEVVCVCARACVCVCTLVCVHMYVSGAQGCFKVKKTACVRAHTCVCVWELLRYCTCVSAVSACSQLEESLLLDWALPGTLGAERGQRPPCCSQTGGRTEGGGPHLQGPGPGLRRGWGSRAGGCPQPSVSFLSGAAAVTGLCKHMWFVC